MAVDISQETQAIRTAVFAKDVRDSIAGGLDTMASEVNTYESNLSADNDQFKTDITAQEAQHAQAESTRVTAEQGRVSAETTRQSNEQTRQTNETNRVSEFNTIKTAYESATHENTSVELTAARTSGVTGQSYNNIGLRMDNTDSQLANIMNYNAYKYIATDNLQDYTDEINQACTKAKNNNCKYLYFLKPLNYIVNNELINSNNLIFIGNGEIISTNENNYRKIILPIGKYFYEQHINCSQNKEKIFNTFMNSINVGNSNVCFFGDSLLTEHPNSITYDDGVTAYMFKKIKEQFSNVTFNYFNRAIGGKVAWEGANKPATSDGLPSWYTDYNKNWLTYVQSTNPDLLIIGFGMNEGDTYHRHYSSIKSIIDTINTWDKIPSIVFVTTPPCAYIIGDDLWGSKVQQEYRWDAASITRYFGLMNNIYVLDVNRLISVLRDGIDVCRYSKKLICNDITKWTLTGTASSLTSSSIKLDVNSIIAYMSQKFRNFVITFDYVTPANSSSENIIIRFRGGDSENYYQMHINSQGFNLYDNDVLIETLSYSFSPNTTYNVSINIVNNSIYIFINNTQIVVWNDIYRYFDDAFISLQAITAGDIVLNNLQIFDAVPLKYTAILCNNEIYGEYVKNDFSTKPTGGNGVNHFSANGYAETYYKCIDEFIKDLSLISQNNNKDFYKKGTINITFPPSSCGYKLIVMQSVEGNPSAIAEYNILVLGQTEVITIAETSNTSFSDLFKINSTNKIVDDGLGTNTDPRTLIVPLGTSNLTDNYVRIICLNNKNLQKVTFA